MVFLRICATIKCILKAFLAGCAHAFAVAIFPQAGCVLRKESRERDSLLCNRRWEREHMANYRIVIQYDGTRYRGWQSQNSTEETIQGRIQTVLSRMAEEDVEVTGSGRTDAGVHAAGQTANFHLSGSYEKEAVLDYLNRYLPEDIAVSRIDEVDERFHSRYRAKSKTYLYRIHTDRVPEVFARRYVYEYQVPLDVKRMRKAAEVLVGTHDFKSFCGNRKMKKSTVRTIYEIRIEACEGELRVYYTGDGFLQNMVRILTGTLIEVGDGRREPEDMRRILDAKERTAAGYTAPACGLTLLRVDYGDE